MLMEDSTEGMFCTKNLISLIVFRTSCYISLYIAAGTVSVKKCLKGDGQICIDSDESIIKGAKAYAATKKNTTIVRKSSKGRPSSGATAGLNPDPNFIGVMLSSNGNPERVYMDEN